MSVILTPFVRSRLFVGALIAIIPHFSAKLLLLPSSRAFILPMRACGVREFVLGGLLFSARNSDEAFQRQALLAGAAVDALDVVFTVATWVLGDLDGAPAGVLAGCACTNLLLGWLCLRALGAGKAGKVPKERGLGQSGDKYT